MVDEYWNRPCAVRGLKSYRYRGRYGWIMIGAMDDAEALGQAALSTDNIRADRLEVWNGQQYVPIVVGESSTIATKGQTCTH